MTCSADARPISQIDNNPRGCARDYRAMPILHVKSIIIISFPGCPETSARDWCNATTSLTYIILCQRTTNRTRWKEWWKAKELYRQSSSEGRKDLRQFVLQVDIGKFLHSLSPCLSLGLIFNKNFKLVFFLFLFYLLLLFFCCNFAVQTLIHSSLCSYYDLFFYSHAHPLSDNNTNTNNHRLFLSFPKKGSEALRKIKFTMWLLLLQLVGIITVNIIRCLKDTYYHHYSPSSDSFWCPNFSWTAAKWIYL